MGFRWELWDLDGVYMRYTSHKFHKSVKCTTYTFLITAFLLVFCMYHLTPITLTISPKVWLAPIAPITPTARASTPAQTFNVCI